MIDPPRSPLPRYLIAAVAVGAATAIRLGLRAEAGRDHPFGAYYLAVISTVILGGLGPSIAAIVVSCLVLLFLPPSPLVAGGAAELVWLGLFSASGGALASYGEFHRAARRRLAAALAERAEAEETITEQARLAEFGRDIGPALTRSVSIREMLDGCAKVAVSHLDAAFARIWTADESGEVLELQASAGLYTHIDGAHARIPVGKFKIGQIAGERRAHLTNSVIGDPRVPEQEWARREGMVAFAGYPLVVEGRLVGVFALFARHPLSGATLRMIGSVALEIAIGIERKRAEGRALEQKEWFRVTLSSIGDAVIATDTRGSISYMNGVAEELTGWPLAEASGRALGEVFRIENEETGLPVEDPATRAIREGRVVGLANHTVLIARDGAVRAISDGAAPIRDASGSVLGAAIVFRGVEEEREAERALAESEARFRTMAESIPQLAWMTRPDGYIVWYNKRWYEYTGTTSEEMEGWGWRSVHDPAELPRVEAKFLASLRSGEPWEDTFPLRRVDGEFRQHLSRARPVRDDRGEILCWFGTNTDITDRIEMEEALRAAKREAEAANEAKSQFLAVLSHELRTPLNPILLAASAMLEDPESVGDLRPTMEMIRQNVNLQARLIDDLLDVMRIVRGKMPLHWEVVDCHKLIEQAIRICRSEVFGQSLRLQADLSAPRHSVNADAARLQQVLWNLIKNAVKFTPLGGEITIRTANEPDGVDGPGLLRIEVADDGIGIDPAILPKIFDPFQQGESTITRKFGGLGLGLAICRGIVEAHGGVLSAESAGTGLGTTFRVELKALPDSAAEERAEPPGRGGPPTDHASAILVVEDEPATLRLMARLLRNLGHSVTTAGTVGQAVEEYAKSGFDLIISDIGLPDGSGHELMKRVVATRGPIPAIALTGYGMEEDIRRSREAGFTAHLTKPIDFSKLVAMILQIRPQAADRAGFDPLSPDDRRPDHAGPPES